jgi:serine/threonine-protein kinase RsbW
LGNCLTVNMRLELELPALPECVRRAREAITELSEELQLGLDVVERIRLAVTEACTNCVQHAYPDDHPNPTYMLEASLQACALVIVVHDCGVGFVPGQRSAHAGLGLGLRLIDKLADSAGISSHTGHGTRVEMRFAARESRGVT